MIRKTLFIALFSVSALISCDSDSDGSSHGFDSNFYCEAFDENETCYVNEYDVCECYSDSDPGQPGDNETNPDPGQPGDNETNPDPGQSGDNETNPNQGQSGDDSGRYWPNTRDIRSGFFWNDCCASFNDGTSLLPEAYACFDVAGSACPSNAESCWSDLYASWGCVEEWPKPLPDRP